MVNGNLLLRRKDLLEPAGFTAAPQTWEELVAQAVALAAGNPFLTEMIKTNARKIDQAKAALIEKLAAL